MRDRPVGCLYGPMSDRDWTCTAYGDAPTHVCFTGQECASVTECTAAMSEERKRLFRRMQHAAATDPLWADISEDFPNPESLLGGNDA